MKLIFHYSFLIATSQGNPDPSRNIHEIWFNVEILGVTEIRKLSSSRDQNNFVYSISMYLGLNHVRHIKVQLK